MMFKPSIISWARQEAGLSLETAADKLSVQPDRFRAWETGDIEPDMKEVRQMASSFHVPFPYFFYDEAPELKLPIADFRVPSGAPPRKPSLDLLEVLGDTMNRQEWMLSHGREYWGDSTNRLRSDSEVNRVEELSAFAEIDRNRSMAHSHAEFLNFTIRTLWERGIMVVRSGVVAGNNYRPLDTDEFQGFSLNDENVPLIFLNGKDYVAAQIFTLFHELVHLLLGNDSGVFGEFHADAESEINRLAGKALLSDSQIRAAWNPPESDERQIAQQFKVSEFMVLVRARQARVIFEDEYATRQQEAKSRIKKSATRGGNFWLALPYRTGGYRFLEAVIVAAMEDRITLREGYYLTGVHGDKFKQLLQWMERGWMHDGWK